MDFYKEFLNEADIKIYTLKPIGDVIHMYADDMKTGCTFTFSLDGEQVDVGVAKDPENQDQVKISVSGIDNVGDNGRDWLQIKLTDVYGFKGINIEYNK